MSNLGIFLRRYFVAFGFAAVATGALILLMENLIRPDFAEVEAKQPPTKFDLFPVIKDTPPPPPPELPPPTPVETPPRVILVANADPTTITWGEETLYPGPEKNTFNMVHSQADGGLMVISQVPPNYPERARRGNIQGYVVVEFTVDRTGAVRNARVVESEPSSIFDRAAVQSIERSKYRPRREDGKALMVHGVRKRLSFNLES